MSVIMHRTRRAAAVLALAIGVAVSSAGLAAASQAAQAAQAWPAGIGSFATWTAAQKAVGFGLVKPSVTYGLHRDGKIFAVRCRLRGGLAKRVVEAGYGNPASVYLGIDQSTSSRQCGKTRPAKSTYLGHFRVSGVWASLAGFCGLPSLPSCTSAHVRMVLTWLVHGIYYQAFSCGERRAQLLGFARGLVRVA